MALTKQQSSAYPVERCIDVNGRPLGGLPDIASSRDRLVELYRRMVLTRVFDEKAVALQRTGQLGTFASSLGQEAVGVGLASAMAPNDILLPSFREQSAQLARSVLPSELFLFWGGDERGSQYVHQEGDFPVCIPVASHFPHAAGVALALKQKSEARVAVAVAGDGATSKGDFYEAINVAGVWNLPAVFVIANNQWAISVPRSAQTAAETLAQKAIAAGIEGCVVDGNDVLAVHKVTEAAVNKARNGGGPTLIEAQTYRLSDHTTVDDARRYRDDEEVSEQWQFEPIARLRAYLTSHFDWTKDEEHALQSACHAEIERGADTYLKTPPQPAETMFAHLYGVQTGPSDDATGKQDRPDATEITLLGAVNLAIARAMEDDADVIILGEDVGVNGGVFRATDGLATRFGLDRVRDTPLAEAVIAGLSVGMAAQGLRPVAEIQFEGFMFPTLDQMINHASRLRTRTRGRLSCPMVLRAPYGGGIHAPEHHSDSVEAFFAHIPGLRVVIPSTPQRAYGLLLASIRDPDPVVFLEPKRIYRSSKGAVIDDGQYLPLNECFLDREGSDVTLIGWGAMMNEIAAAADRLAEDGISAEIIDVATLYPLNDEAICRSVEKTGRAVIAHEAPLTGGYGGELAARISEKCLLSLLAPVTRVAGPDCVMPLPRLEASYLPGANDVVLAVKEAMKYT